MDEYKPVSSSVAYRTTRTRPRLLPWGLGLVGCLGIGALFAVLIAACIGGAMLAGGYYLQSTDVAQAALEAARNDPAVVEQLGAPINPGWFVRGEISTQGLHGEAQLVIPVSGSKKSGTLYVLARRENGPWRYHTLAVEVDGKLIPVRQ